MNVSAFHIVVLSFSLFVAATAQQSSKGKGNDNMGRGHNNKQVDGTFEEVDIHVNLNLAPEEITDEDLDYMSAALQFAFDETSEGHLYHATFAYLDEIKLEDRYAAVDKNLRQWGSYCK